MFIIYHNSPIGTLSISEENAEELRDTLATAINDLEHPNETAWQTIEDLQSIIDSIEEYIRD